MTNEIVRRRLRGVVEQIVGCFIFHEQESRSWILRGLTIALDYTKCHNLPLTRNKLLFDEGMDDSFESSSHKVEILCHLFSLRLLWHLDTKSRESEGIVSCSMQVKIFRSLRAIISENYCMNVVKGEVGCLVWILPVQSFNNAARR